MTLHTLFSRSAPLAIAASGALFATTAMAQDAAPADAPIVLPPTVEATAPPATGAAAPIMLPDPVVEQAAPVVEAPPAPSARATATTVAPPRSDRAAEAPAAPRTAPAVLSTSAATATGVAPVAAIPAAQMVPAVAAQPADVAPLSESAVPVAQSDHIDEGLIAGLLGAAGLAAVGGIAFASARRRRNRSIERRSQVIDRTVTAPVGREPARDPVVATSVATAAAAPRTTSVVHGNGDPVPLPAEIPASMEERVALIERLASAKPDKANPFTSRKARVKRARMIVNALGMNFAQRKPRIDLSEYTNRWPALRGWQPATS